MLLVMADKPGRLKSSAVCRASCCDPTPEVSVPINVEKVAKSSLPEVCANTRELVG
jgi:hypothetical protein